MGATERGIDATSGLRHVIIDHPLWAFDTLCFSIPGGLAVGTVVSRDGFFGGTGNPGLSSGTLRTKTLTLVASGVAGTRLLKFRVWLNRPDGEQIQEVVTIPTFTAGQTARAETFNPGYIVAFMLEPGSTGFDAGDDFHIGELWSNTVGSSLAPAVPIVYFANVVFGLPIQMRPTRRDASGGLLGDASSFQSGFNYTPNTVAGATFLALGSPIAFATMRYDDRGGFKFIADTAPLTASATQVVMMRTAWIGYPLV